MDKGEIGRRIRAVRQEKGLSLRQVATAAALSATHISEIERGHTTPTVGALVRIAGALESEPHFFLEPEWLPEISVIRAADSPERHRLSAFPAEAESLTRGIPGGRLTGSRIFLDPHSEPTETISHGGELTGYLRSGSLQLRVGEDEFDLRAGDCFHLRADLPHQIWNAGDERAEMIFVATHPYSAAR